MSYVPRPIDTSAVALPSELEALAELLAAHVHDTWAEARMAEGWRFGPQRDDGAMTRPDLVPYEDLVESEKEYDRRTALETLRAVLALGYVIKPAK